MKTKNKKITARRIINFILELYVALSFWGMFLAGAERGRKYQPIMGLRLDCKRIFCALRSSAQA